MPFRLMVIQTGGFQSFKYERKLEWKQDLSFVFGGNLLAASLKEKNSAAWTWTVI